MEDRRRLDSQRSSDEFDRRRVFAGSVSLTLTRLLPAVYYVDCFPIRLAYGTSALIQPIRAEKIHFPEFREINFPAFPRTSISLNSGKCILNISTSGGRPLTGGINWSRQNSHARFQAELLLSNQSRSPLTIEKQQPLPSNISLPASVRLSFS